MPSLKTVAFGANIWFGFFEGVTEGYSFRTCATADLENNIASLLKASDASLTAIAYGQSTWFVQCDTMNPLQIGDRHVVVSRNFDDFTARVDAHLAQARALKCVHFGDGTWVAYFEGEVSGTCTWSTSPTTEELVAELQEQLEKGLTLAALCYGEGLWFAYFNGILKDDGQWAMEANFDAFAAKTQTLFDQECFMRVAAFGDGRWFGFWEGKLEPTSPASFGARAKVLDFVDYVREAWDEDEGVPVQPAGGALAAPAPTSKPRHSPLPLRPAQRVAAEPATREVSELVKRMSIRK